MIDDSQTNLAILAEMLREWGMQTTAARNAREALELLHKTVNEHRPLPLLLCDVHMPEEDGLEFITRLRSMGEFSTVSVVMLTSGLRNGDQAKCQTLGVSAHLLKPVKQSELLAAILTATGNEVPQSSDQAEVSLAIARDAVVPIGLDTALRVLLVEDGLANQQLATGILQRDSHEVMIANDGIEALECLQQHSFDLILMDVQMPRMDGFETTRQIRLHEREQSSGRTPIIAMTAHALSGDRERCLDAGMDGYISKPVRRSQLFATIRSVLSGTETTDDAAITYKDSSRTAPELCTGESVVDWGVALDAVGGERSLLQEVVATFLEECPILVKQLDDAINDADARTVQRAAHTIKGSFRLFEVAFVVNAAKELEDIGRSGDLTNARTTLTALRESLDRVIPELAAFASASV